MIDWDTIEKEAAWVAHSLEEGVNWDAISKEAAIVAHHLIQESVNLSEAKKAGHYFVDHNYNEEKMRKYLNLLVENPPIRSNQSARYYRQLHRVWMGWESSFTGHNKARVWGWAVRLVQSRD